MSQPSARGVSLKQIKRGAEDGSHTLVAHARVTIVAVTTVGTLTPDLAGLFANMRSIGRGIKVPLKNIHL